MSPVRRTAKKAAAPRSTTGRVSLGGSQTREAQRKRAAAKAAEAEVKPFDHEAEQRRFDEYRAWLKQQKEKEA